MKRAHMGLLTLLAASVLPATANGDFSNSALRLHPYVPQYRPFVIELSGVWEGSCHPGIATPVVTAVDGLAIDIELELDPIPPCLPGVESPYRVLIDLSQHFDVNDLDPIPASDLQLDVTINFLNNTFHDTPLLGCFGPAACPLGMFTIGQAWPDTGLYQGQGLLKQGLLIARQGGSMAAYPLTYDADGKAEWLYTGGKLETDTYFAPLYEASGGQCLGCPPPDEPPTLEPIGNISMVFDSAGVAQVKIDDGPFTEYRAIDFGYGQVNGIPDLSGRWALADTDLEIQNNGSVPPGHSLPLVFDLVTIPPPIVMTPPHATFSLQDTGGEELTDLFCEWDFEDGELSCVLRNPDYDDGSHSFQVEVLSPKRIRLTDMGPMLSVGLPATGEAVRLE